MTTGTDGRRHRCMRGKARWLRAQGTESETVTVEGWIESKDEFRIQGGRGPQVMHMQSNSQIHPSHPPKQEPANPQLVGDRRNNYFHASLRSWVVAQALLSLSVCLSVFLCPSPTLFLFLPLLCPPRPSSGTVCLLARFQVNQRQIQGRAQPNFGPSWKPWPGPHFYSSRNGRPLTIGLSASDGSS